jgi:putative transcriptional regulator
MPPMRMTQFCALALLSWLGTAGAEFAPERGMLLVAQPQVTGRHFAQTVVLVLHHDDDGTLGLILNRPTDVRARELLGDMDDLRDYNEPIFIGGPVAPTAIAILARGISGSGENRPQAIVDDVYVHSDLELLAGLSPRERRERVRLYAGHSAWQAGQLAQEIGQGQWRVVNGSARLVFTNTPLELWEALLALPSGPLVHMGLPTGLPNPSASSWTPGLTAIRTDLYGARQDDFMHALRLLR